MGRGDIEGRRREGRGGSSQHWPHESRVVGRKGSSLVDDGVLVLVQNVWQQPIKGANVII